MDRMPPLKRMFPPWLAAFGFLATQAMAQNAPGTGAANILPAAKAPPGAVQRLVLAHALTAEARARRDALTALAAARLAQGVVVQDSPGLAPSSPPLTPGPKPPPPAQPDAIFALARTLAAGDDLLLELIEREEGQGRSVPPATVNAAPSALAPGQSETWRIALFGQSLAEIGLIGAGASTLNLVVTDDAQHPVCRDIAPADHALCAFVPADNSFFNATVTNVGPQANSYWLLTN